MEGRQQSWLGRSIIRAFCTLVGLVAGYTLAALVVFGYLKLVGADQGEQMVYPGLLILGGALLGGVVGFNMSRTGGARRS